MCTYRYKDTFVWQFNLSLRLIETFGVAIVFIPRNIETLKGGVLSDLYNISAIRRDIYIVAFNYVEAPCYNILLFS
jgi:hypothetical protein